MEWTITFEPDASFAVATLRGQFTVEAHRALVEDIVGQPQWRPGCPILFDNRQLDFAGVHFTDLLKVADSHAEQDARIGTARSAILTEPGVDYGIMRQFELIAADTVSAQLCIFTDEHAARCWLAIPPVGR